jgi:hypothetical protein
VRELGTIEDELADLQVAESAILEMLGENAPRRGRAWRRGFRRVRSPRLGRPRTAQRRGLDYRRAVEAGVFTSQNKFGTVSLGQIASRDEAVEFLAQGNAPAGSGHVDRRRWAHPAGSPRACSR